MTKKSITGSPISQRFISGPCDWAHNHWCVTSGPIVAVCELYTKSCNGARLFVKYDDVKYDDSTNPVTGARRHYVCAFACDNISISMQVCP